MRSEKTIILPSFLRKTLKAYALKAEIRSIGCELNRIGRSRNWKIVGSKQQLMSLITFIEASEEPTWLWLAKHLRNKQDAFTHQELVSLAIKNPNITINQLVSRTDCTIVQARRVIDELEFQD